jgi:hypothetical protein
MVFVGPMVDRYVLGTLDSILIILEVLVLLVVVSQGVVSSLSINLNSNANFHSVKEEPSLVIQSITLFQTPMNALKDVALRELNVPDLRLNSETQIFPTIILTVT